MSKSILKIITLAAIAAALTLIGCGDDAASSQTGAKADAFLGRFAEEVELPPVVHPLVLGDGGAWLNMDGDSDAFVFHEDYKCYWIEKAEDNRWSVVDSGIWNTEGIVSFEIFGAYSYGIDGDYQIITLENLNWHEVHTARKASGIYFNL